MNRILRFQKAGLEALPQVLKGTLCIILLSANSIAFSEAQAQTRPVELDTLQVQIGSRVSSSLPALTRSIQLLGRKAIENLPVRTVAELLDWATAVEVQSRSPAQSDFGIRGSSFEQVVVLVNGVRMSDPQTGHFDLNLAVPLDRVARVEVLRGPASALYGADAVGGVVNIVTLEDDAGWVGRLEGGSWGTAKVSGGGGAQWDGGPSLSFGGEVSRSDGHRSGTDFEVALLHVSLQDTLAGGKLAGDFGVSRRDFGAQDFYAPYPSFEKTRTYTSALRWASAGIGDSRVEFGAAFRRHEDEFTLIRDDPAVYQNHHVSSQVGGDLLVREGGGSGIDLVVGGELYRDLLQSESLGDRGETRGAVFSEMVLGRTGRGVVSLGLRHDWHEEFGSVTSPSVSGSLRWGPSLRFRLGLGRSFRAPTWTERYYRDPVNVGMPHLKPERAWSGEVGLDAAKGSNLHLSFSAFVRRAEDLIDWARGFSAPSGSPWETRNVEEATFKGLEVELAAGGPWETRWSLGGMVLSVDSKESSGFESKYALRPLEQKMRIGVGRSFWETVTLDLNVHRARRRGEEPYHRLDIRAGIRVGSGRFYLDANNLLDARHPDVTGALAPGRGIYLGWQRAGRAGAG